VSVNEMRRTKPTHHNRACGVYRLALLSLAYLLSGCSPTHADWDAKVKELCQKEGGVTVYERVRLSKEEARQITGPAGGLVVPRKESAAATSPYISENKRTTLNDGNPAVFRSETIIVRTSDGKVLSRLIHYARVKRGGVDSGYTCRDLGIAVDLEQKTFEVVGGQ
jgi:hypothetical protein